MIRSMIQILLIFSMCMLTACKKEDPNPELGDPIYKDLQGKLDGYTRNIEAGKKKLEELEAKLEKAEPRSIDLKNLQKEIAKEKAQLLNSEQLSRYYRIRTERRKLWGRLEYKKAFAQDKPWPDPNEIVEYQTNLRLEQSSRNWGSRVPKLQDRMTAKAAAPKAEAPKGH